MAKAKNRKELEAAREIAFMLFMNSITAKEISERIGISQQSLSKWITEGNWKEKRAAKTITRVELINKTLNQINDLLSTEQSLSSAAADKLVKLAALIERLDKKNSPIQAMEVFIDFISWIQKQSVTDRALSVDFIKNVNKYQDAYISTLMIGK